MKLDIFDVKPEINYISSNIEFRVEDAKKLAKASSDNLEDFKNILIEMEVLKENLSFCSENVRSSIEKVLKDFKETKGTIEVGKLGALLEKANNFGKGILDDHTVFDQFNAALFIQKCQKFGIDYVLQKIDGTNIRIDLLRKKYDEFDKTYKELVKTYLKKENKFTALVSNLKLLIGNLKTGEKTFNDNTNKTIVEIMVYILSLWTLLNSAKFFDSNDSEEAEKYLMQPHPAQIIGIFRIFGIGDEKEILTNNLVQIGTGEGKSIFLAVVSSVFALLGFNVSCACYSQYLSERDFKSFEVMFEYLGIKEFIKYGTFNRLCESYINRDGDLRKIVENFIMSGKHLEKLGLQSNRPEILLIDEVDVFFSKDFYGKPYIPSTSIKDPSIDKLINFIWSKRNEKNITMKLIQTSAEYKECVSKFKHWENLIEESVKDMIYDVKNFDSQSYEINEKTDRIGYTEQDQIFYNKIYGYQTMFVYFKEVEKGRIKTKERLTENMALHIYCGYFSFAEIPKKFDYIMGVTGTLKTLNAYEEELIKTEYKIEKKTFMPSVFGDSNFGFSKTADIFVEKSENYYIKIINEITNRMN